MIDDGDSTSGTPPSMADLARHLASRDDETRRAAVGAIPGAGAEALRLLLRALGDRSWRVRKEAAWRMGQWPDQAAAATALAEVFSLDTAALGETDAVGLRNAAVEALSRIGRASIPALAVVLPSTDAAARKLMAETLGEIGAPEGMALLVRLLGDADANAAATAAEALGRLGAVEAVPALLAALEPRGDAQGAVLIQLAALGSLARLGARLDVAELAPLMNDPILRRTAVEALGRSGDPAAAPHLVLALADRPPTGGTAIVALARLVASLATLGEPNADAEGLIAGTATLAPRLYEALRSTDPDVRSAAADLLGRFGNVEALGPLCVALDDLTVSDAALTAIRRLAARTPDSEGLARRIGEEFVGMGNESRKQLLGIVPTLGHTVTSGLIPLLAEALADEDGELARAAARILGEAGGEAELGVLFRILDRDFEVAQAASEAIIRIAAHHPKRTRALVEAYDLAKSSLGPYLCRILGAAGTVDDVPRLLPALHAEQAAVRRAAIEALGQIGGPGVGQAVAFALADEAAEVRAAAVRSLAALAKALASSGETTVVDRLLPVVSDPDTMVRAAALRALGNLGDKRAASALREHSSSPDGLTARAALEALASLGEADVATLATALSHGDPEVVKQAVRSLGALGAAAQGALAGVLGHPRWDIRSVAAQAYVRALGEAGHPALKERLEVEADEMVRQVIRAELASPPTPAGGRKAQGS